MNSEQMLQDMLMAQETENVQKATHSLADDMVVQADRETPMTVGQVIECTKAWVSIQAEQRPGVLGAHLMGGITLMALDEAFPIYRDVDLHLIFHDDVDVPGENAEALYKGLMIEAGFRHQKDYPIHSDTRCKLICVPKGHFLTQKVGLTDPRTRLAPSPRRTASASALPVRNV